MWLRIIDILSICCCHVVVMSLISHPYSDSLAPYLGTAILTILCLEYQLINYHRIN